MKPARILLLSLFIAFPASAWAGSHIVYVPAPNGIDDTSNIQAGLDACVAYGKNCTAQLAAGTYLTRQLVEHNFQGSFKGMGQTKTTIQALPNLLVTLTDPFIQGECKPDTSNCLWPSLIIFVDGNITVSDLTVDEPNVPATQPWYILGSELTYLNDGIRFMGQNRTNASVQRVTATGALDNSLTSCPDFNFCNAVIFAGEYPRTQTPFDYYFLSGTFSVYNSSFTTVSLGVGADGFLKDSKVTIGGSPTTGNVFQNVDFGFAQLAAQNSFEDASYNRASMYAYNSYGEPVTVAPWVSAFAPSQPSLFLIHDNYLTATGPYANGIFIQDGSSTPWLYAQVYNNTIEAQDVGGDVISIYSTTGTAIVNNKVSGTGPDAIGIWNGTYAAVLDNDLAAFTANPDAGLAQIVLDGSLEGLPDTSNSTVVCKARGTTVLNLGSNNTIIGCQQVENRNTQSSKMSLGRKATKKKPLFP